MTSPAETRTWTAVCISRQSPDHAADALGRALGDAGAAGTDLRALGQFEQQHALEADFTATAAGARAIGQSLAAGAGDMADVAVVPSVGRKKRLLICDMDSTVIGQECLDELADFAGKKADVSEITERAMRGELDFEGALTTRVAMLAGLSLDALEQCFEERISLNPGARVLVGTMTANGARAVLVSGGFTFFTERVARLAGFEDHQGNTLEDDGQALTGEVGRPILGREAKLTALEAETAAIGVGASDALAMGDGANDLAMITAAGLGVAYRAKPIVAAEADAAINVCDLTAALFFQGYRADEFVVR